MSLPRASGGLSNQLGMQDRTIHDTRTHHCIRRRAACRFYSQADIKIKGISIFSQGLFLKIS
jgi:hypothetical protein